jgi:sulfite reductase alpha subunit
VKASGCGNDCVASIARADMSVIGTWRDEIQIDQDEIRAAAADGMNIERDICGNCPTKCIEWDGSEMTIDDDNCVKCMHCINALPKGLAPGNDRGACILLGAKAPIVEGAQLSSVLVPFMKLEAPYEELYDLIERIWDFWGEHGKNRERVGELMQRVGLGNFLEEIEVEPIPEMVAFPRDNPYVFYEEYYEEEEEEE